MSVWIVLDTSYLRIVSLLSNPTEYLERTTDGVDGTSDTAPIDAAVTTPEWGRVAFELASSFNSTPLLGSSIAHRGSA
jgi:hypothetical protein